MKNRDGVLSFVKEKPRCTQQEISKALSITSTAQVNQILHTLMDDGLVGRDEQQMPYKYYPVKVKEEDIVESITKDNMLIVVSCTAQKVWDKGNWGSAYVPAIHAYAGNSIKWLRDNVPSGKGLHCIILSAKYGFIEPEHPIHNYDVTFPKPKNKNSLLKENEKAAISDNSLRNQVMYQPRLFGKDERKLCSFKYVLVKGSSLYIQKCREAFGPEAHVQELTDELWSRIVAKLDP